MNARKDRRQQCLGARGLAARWRSTTSGTLAAALVRLALDPAAEGRVVESDELRR
jgi:hypothetical protein